MFKRIVIIIVVVALVAGGAYLALNGRGVEAAAPGGPTAEQNEQAIMASRDVIAEGKVMPVSRVAVGFAASGLVAEVVAQEGEVVAQDALIARLDDGRLLAAVAEAESALAIAEARLRQAQAGPRVEDQAAYQAGVEVAKANVLTAEGAVATAKANVQRARTGATAQEISIAERRIELAKNALWAAQARRDAVCGRVGRGALEADCDTAQAAVQQGEEEVRIAGLQLDQVKAGPQAADIAAAWAALEQAEGQHVSAQAQVKKAEADVASALKGASPEELAIAQAQVEQAKVALTRAQLALQDSRLQAPIAGTVVKLNVKPGEVVNAGAPVLQVADLTEWVIETTDLSELKVVKIAVGDAATIRFDALPGVEIPGTVSEIKALGETVRGEITYTVLVKPEAMDARLRWNMTAEVSIHPAE
jgi:HlyD family secretion protein